MTPIKTGFTTTFSIYTLIRHTKLLFILQAEIHRLIIAVTVAVIVVRRLATDIQNAGVSAEFPLAVL